MTTTAQNLESYAWGPSLPYPVDTTGSNDIKAGELVYYDTSAHQVKTAASDANIATFAGVAKDSSFKNLYGTKDYGAGQIDVATGGRYTFKSTSGDTMNHGDPCFIGADAQTITTTDPGAGHKIGYVWMRPGQSAVAGGSTVLIDVLIVPLYPIVGAN